MNIKNNSHGKLYRETAGIILKCGEEILLCKAVTGNWAMPQGGIKSYETPIEAAKRELKEEVNVDSDCGHWLGPTPWMILILPPERRQSRRYRKLIGQKYIWFICECAQKPTIVLNTREFRSQFMWTNSETILRLSGFKQRIYAKAFEYFGLARKSKKS